MQTAPPSAGQKVSLPRKMTARVTAVFTDVMVPNWVEVMSNLLRVYDLPDPMQTAGLRNLTTTPLQQLFILNSGFMRDEAAALGKSVQGEPDPAATIRSLFRQVLSRDPLPEESQAAVHFLSEATAEQYAQILLSSNEEIFWP